MPRSNPFLPKRRAIRYAIHIRPTAFSLRRQGRRLGDGPDGVYNRIEDQYDRQGNMTQMKDPNGTIHDCDYDSRGDWREPRPIPRQRDPQGEGAVRRRPSQPIEERQGASTDAERQWVWEPRNRNALILRDRDCPPAARDDLQSGFAIPSPRSAAKQSTGDGSFDERLYATRDAMGSVTALLDTGGTVQERYGYTAFGVRRVMAPDFSSRASSNYDWRLGFHGEFLDTDTRYVNYGYRHYSPEIGRWLSRDPIGEDGGVNLYTFAENCPTVAIDLVGLKICKWPNIKDIEGIQECNHQKAECYLQALEEFGITTGVGGVGGAVTGGVAGAVGGGPVGAGGGGVFGGLVGLVGGGVVGSIRFYIALNRCDSEYESCVAPVPCVCPPALRR